MDKLVRKGIIEILSKNKKLLRIPIRQKAKFEGWLKFELAHYLEQKGMKHVEVESKVFFRRDRTDITFFFDETPHSIEIKTPNTNWKINGVSNNNRPISKNISSIIKDAIKLNSENGIVAFVLFPVPHQDTRWEMYLKRINEKTGISLNKENNCEVMSIRIDEKKLCDIVVCTFFSRRFRNW